MVEQKVSIKNITFDKLTEIISPLGYKKKSAEKLFSNIYKYKKSSFKDINNVPPKLIDILENDYLYSSIKLYKRIVSNDGTIKYLWQLYDDCFIESVLLNYGQRYIICTSTQVGCSMNCAFCFTAKKGFKRNLSCSEIIEQIWEIAKLEQLDTFNVVFMGMGEPLLNLDELRNAINTITNHFSFMLSERHITVSTCGILPQMYEIIEDNWQCKVSLSLNASNNELRSSLMPINNKYPIESLIEWMYKSVYIHKKGVTIGYIIINGVNDTPEHIDELILLLKDFQNNHSLKINMIPFNNFRTNKLDYVNLKRIWVKLRNAGFYVFLRETKGSDIKAACGQLTANIEKEI